jgi:ribose transport system ATP-binding protein
MYGRTRKRIGPVVLRIENLSGTGFENISFEVHKGEIVGLAGLVGSGRTELARAIFGADKRIRGKVLIEQQPTRIKQPKDAIIAGIGLLPEDRKEQGLILNLSVRSNLSIVSLRNLSMAGMVRNKKELLLCAKMVDELDIKLADIRNKVKSLSGGNQQKVVVAKWLAQHLKVLIMDEPTRGIDVGAKAEIAAIMNDLADQGMALIMISSELPELGICDKILVLGQGRIRGSLTHEEFSEKAIMNLMFKVER